MPKLKIKNLQRRILRLEFCETAAAVTVAAAFQNSKVKSKISELKILNSEFAKHSFCNLFNVYLREMKFYAISSYILVLILRG